MVKIKSIYFSAALIVLILIASFDVIFMKGAAGYNLLLIYAVIMSLAGYALHDSKMEKKHILGALFLLLSFILVSVVQYIFSFHRISVIGLAVLFLAAACICVFFVKFYIPDSVKIMESKFALTEVIILVLILLLALFLRLYKSGVIPPGIWFDEAQNGNEVLRILHGNPLEVFIPRLTMMPAMYFYIAAFFTEIFGVNIEALRLVSVITGVLSIAAFYYLCRYIFKDKTLALAGAFLMATSRWHITFSRVAFLGMLTLLLAIICFYFYLKAINEGGKINAVLSGLAMGMALYTYSGANFIPIVVVLHILFSLFDYKAINIKRNITLGITALAVAAVIASPLALYAVHNPEVFSKRFNDLSIANDIKKENSVMPLLKSIQVHLLMFNFEGDYNGRHNLYKKPMLDMITGVLLIGGFLVSIASPGSLVYFIWFFVMLSAGIMTISIEAPQSYRIIGILPVIYIFMLFLLDKIRAVLYRINKKSSYFIIFICVILSASASLNIYQYFVLYPEEKATYMSFSPEANAISRFVRENSKEYCIYISPADNMYGFFKWEQRLICDFANLGGSGFEYLNNDNMIKKERLKNKKGLVLILRPSDTGLIKDTFKQFPKAVKKEFTNRFTDEIMFICYYIEKEQLNNEGPIIHVETDKKSNNN